MGLVPREVLGGRALEGIPFNGHGIHLRSSTAAGGGGDRTMVKLRGGRALCSLASFSCGICG